MKLGLLLAEMGQKNEIQVSDAEMTQAIMNQARQYPGNERQFFEFVQQVTSRSSSRSVRRCLKTRLIDYIFELATITEVEADKDKLKEAVDALEEE